MIRAVVTISASGPTPSSSISRWKAAIRSVIATIADAAAIGDTSGLTRPARCDSATRAASASVIGRSDAFRAVRNR